jgi:hypothetical protein
MRAAASPKYLASRITALIYLIMMAIQVAEIHYKKDIDGHCADIPGIEGHTQKHLALRATASPKYLSIEDHCVLI